MIRALELLKKLVEEGETIEKSILAFLEGIAAHVETFATDEAKAFAADIRADVEKLKDAIFTNTLSNVAEQNGKACETKPQEQPLGQAGADPGAENAQNQEAPQPQVSDAGQKEEQPAAQEENAEQKTAE